MAVPLALFITLLAVHLVARAQAGPGPDGRALFLTHCASCHGENARGDGPVAASLRTPPSDLTRFAARNGGVFPSARTYRIIDGRDVRAHGTAEMPVWGNVFRVATPAAADADVRARIEAIVRYLDGIQERSGHEDSAGRR